MKVHNKLFIIILFFISNAFAVDNPCGVNCTERISTEVSTNVASTISGSSSQNTLVQANAYTDEQFDKVYERVVIYGEDNGICQKTLQVQQF